MGIRARSARRGDASGGIFRRPEHPFRSLRLRRDGVCDRGVGGHALHGRLVQQSPAPGDGGLGADRPDHRRRAGRVPRGGRPRELCGPGWFGRMVHRRRILSSWRRPESGFGAHRLGQHRHELEPGRGRDRPGYYAVGIDRVHVRPVLEHWGTAANQSRGSRCRDRTGHVMGPVPDVLQPVWRHDPLFARGERIDRVRGRRVHRRGRQVEVLPRGSGRLDRRAHGLESQPGQCRELRNCGWVASLCVRLLQPDRGWEPQPFRGARRCIRTLALGSRGGWWDLFGGS